MKRIIVPIAVVAVLVAAFWIIRSRRAEGASAYRFAQVERGDVTQVVSTTGKLQAIKSVQVGTQVSGQISELHVDFNDRVRKGQLLARIDPTVLQQEVRSAEASLERASASLDEKRRQFERDTLLYARRVLSESDYETSRYNWRVARAELQSARISLARARRNLAYTEITAPIDGIVVERNVDVGQTVAASFSAPQLFLLAEDLSKLEILADVDESDIGQIRQDQDVSFSVQSFPDRTFHGRVRQVRLQSTTTSNVVTYTVVVAVDNPGGQLLPGMTATVDFEVAKAADVLKVSSAALRLQPTTAMLAQLPKRARPDSTRRQPGAARAGSGQRDSTLARRAPADSASMGRLWYLDEKGKLAMMPVRTGISDGKATEVSGPPQLAAGLKVIVAVTGGIASGKSAVSKMLEELGAPIIDYDVIAREIVEPEKPAWKDIVACFGKEVLKNDRRIDRKKLSAIVFRDANKRKKLERFTHPRIIEEAARRADEIAGRNPNAIIQVAVPLLIEIHLQDKFHKVLLVYVPREIQIERLMKRDGITKDAAESILKAQLPIDEKVKYSDFVIHNEGTLEETRRQVEEVWEEIKKCQKKCLKRAKTSDQSTVIGYQ